MDQETIFPSGEENNEKEKNHLVSHMDQGESRKARKLNKKWLIIILIIIVLGVILVKGKKKVEEEEKAPAIKKISVLEVGKDTTKVALLEKVLKITSQDEARVISEYAGRIQEVNFEVGQTVKEGQVLAKFEQSSADNLSVIDLDLASQTVGFARKNLENTEKSIEKDIKIAKDGVALAKIALDRAKKEENCVKHSP